MEDNEHSPQNKKSCTTLSSIKVPMHAMAATCSVKQQRASKVMKILPVCAKPTGQPACDFALKVTVEIAERDEMKENTAPIPPAAVLIQQTTHLEEAVHHKPRPILCEVDEKRLEPDAELVCLQSSILVRRLHCLPPARVSPGKHAVVFLHTGANPGEEAGLGGF